MRVERLLSMLLIIAQRGKVTGQELAEHFEVSLRTIYRDIDKLGEAGVPIAALGGPGGGYYLMENYQVSNLFLNEGEAATFLAVANNLNMLFGKNPHFNDMVLKFEHERRRPSADTWSINLSHFSMEDELRSSLQLMNEALEQSRLLVFDYMNRRMDVEERAVEPVQIAFSGGHWHLNGYCRIRNGYRRFKLVRIRQLRLGGHYEKRPESAEAVQRLLDEGYYHSSIKVTLQFSARIGGQLAEHFPKESITRTEEGHFIATDYFPYEEGLFKFIIGFGKDCTVVDPPQVRNAVQQYIYEMWLSYHG
ncbi:YafY family transcriptional regulator [Paenibacillus dendritiformis]|uniref:helix-turn-helix transcriptional regulator n=1 Tax=Paenibacillus dendritiformis TaxID=130049 RepID=UPI001059FEB2|nr:YafY family protein [Paenibacillus dendritiformis]TDL48564.1 YafY family transcriptional regulator [Paenibacillus dendritiformis]